MTNIQLAFNIHPEPSYSIDNYFVSHSNKDAYDMVSSWPQWSSSALLIQGPHYSGKTHLARLWQIKNQAHYVDDNTNLSLDMIISQILKHPFIIIEQADHLIDQYILLAIYNTVREQQGSMLLTSIQSLSKWPYTLPDLMSRLRSVQSVMINEPDDTLMRALFIKQFSDAQIRITENILDYLMIHVERSYASIFSTVKQLNIQSLTQKRSLTVPFIKDILVNLNG